jgi:hypothetical protein
MPFFAVPQVSDTAEWQPKVLAEAPEVDHGDPDAKPKPEPRTISSNPTDAMTIRGTKFPAAAGLEP